MSPPNPIEYALSALVVGLTALVLLLDPSVTKTNYRIDCIGDGILADSTLDGREGLDTDRPELSPPATSEQSPHQEHAAIQEPKEPERTAPRLELASRADGADETADAPRQVLTPPSEDTNREIADMPANREPEHRPVPSIQPNPPDIATQLPKSAAALFDQLCTEGRRWKAEGTMAPPYRPRMPTELINRLINKHMFRLAVIRAGRTGGNRLFVFGGDLRDPGSPALAGPADVYGFADRLVVLEGEAGEQLARRVNRELGQPLQELQPTLLIHTELDSVVLAVQRRAAEGMGLQLENVERTNGIFQMADGVPFSFTIESIELGGRLIELSARAHLHEVNSIPE